MSYKSSTISAAVAGNWLQANSPFISNNIGVNLQTALTLSAGSGAAQANSIYASPSTLTVSTGTPTVVDLASVTDPDGTSITWSDILAIAIVNLSTTAGQDITVGGGTNPVVSLFTGNLIIKSGGFAIIACAQATGYAFNSSTAHTLEFQVSAGTSVPFGIIVIGH